MPLKPRKPCAFNGCPALTYERYCPVHKQQMDRLYDKGRGSAAKRGYDARWQAARKRFLAEHPLCVECLKQDRLVAAEVVDHIKPHKGDMKLFWNESNWQALCTYHHNAKTAREDGRWG